MADWWTRARSFTPFDEIRVAGHRAVIVAVGADQVGQHLGVAWIRLGPRDGVALAIARRGHGVDGEDLIAGGDQRGHHQAAIDLDADGDLLVVFAVFGHQLMELTDAGHAVCDTPFCEHGSVLVHHADIVMILGPIHSDEDHRSSSHLMDTSPRRSAAT
jgi:hypothetical protein